MAGVRPRTRLDRTPSHAGAAVRAASAEWTCQEAPSWCGHIVTLLSRWTGAARTWPGSGACLRLRRDRGVLGERVRHDLFICSSSSAAFGSLSAVEVARVGSVVGAAG